MAVGLTLEREASHLEQVIEACRYRLSKREEIRSAKKVYITLRLNHHLLWTRTSYFLTDI